MRSSVGCLLVAACASPAPAPEIPPGLEEISLVMVHTSRMDGEFEPCG